MGLSKMCCSYCGKPIETKTDTMPFCGKRCQELDLSNWLDERYGLPWEGEADNEAEFSDSSLVDRQSSSND